MMYSVYKLVRLSFALYWIVKGGAAETVPEKGSVYTRNNTFGTFFPPKQDYFAPFEKYVIPAA